MNLSFRVVAAVGSLAAALVLGSDGRGPQRVNAQTPAGPATVSSSDAAPASAHPTATAESPSAGKPAVGRDIIDTLGGDERFGTLSQALRTSGLLPLLKAKGPFTFFAPTDEAWKKMSSASREELLGQPSRLKAVLSYHIIRGRVDNVGLHKLRNALTMGGIVTIDYTSGVKVSGGVVTSADIVCRNGIVHAIDKVLLPVQRSGPRTAASSKTGSRKTAAIAASSVAEKKSPAAP